MAWAPRPCIRGGQPLCQNAKSRWSGELHGRGARATIYFRGGVCAGDFGVATRLIDLWIVSWTILSRSISIEIGKLTTESSVSFSVIVLSSNVESLRSISGSGSGVLRRSAALRHAHGAAARDGPESPAPDAQLHISYRR